MIKDTFAPMALTLYHMDIGGFKSKRMGGYGFEIDIVNHNREGTSL